MLLRNTLVAHDDFDQIGPQLLFLSINPDGTAFQIPVSIIASHKSILYPSESEKIKQIRDHVTAAATAVIKNLRDDGARLRALIIENPERLYNAPYNRHYGSAYIPPEGAHLTPPDISQDDWLKPRGPAYLITKDGFEYESVRVKFDFFGPEVIKLPNGDEIHITPEKVKKL